MATKLRGAKEMIAKLETLKARATKAVGAGLYALGNNIMVDSSRRVPVDLGTLRSSKYVTLPEKRGGRMTVELGYGGPAEKYAVVQHEEVSYYHEDGEAKFLEKAINAASSGAGELVARVARQAFEQDAGATKTGPTTPGGG